MSDFALAEQASAPAAPRPEPGPLPRRIAETFVSPGALFARFGEKAPWWDVLLIALVVQAVALWMVPIGLYQAMLEQQAATNPNIDPATMAQVGKISGVVFGVLAQVVMAFIVAGVLTVIFRMLMGGDAGYRQYLGVVSHATLITALSVVVSVPLWTAKQDMTARLSLALLAPFLDSGSFLYRVLNGLEVFSLWWVGVLAAGVAATNRRISWGTAAGILFVVLLVFVLIGAVLGGLAGGA